MLSSTIWPIDWTLSGSTSPGQSRPGNYSNERILHIPQNSSNNGPSPLDDLISYQDTPLSGESYPSEEMQPVYSTAPADWALETFWISDW